MFGEKKDNKELEKRDQVIRESFEKVKYDILCLGSEFSSIKSDMAELKSAAAMMNSAVDEMKLSFQNTNALQNQLNNLQNELKELKFLEKSKVSLQNIHNPTHNPTHPTHNPTHFVDAARIPTVPPEIRGLNWQNLGISTRNEGVPTDRQTDQQTDNLKGKTVNQAIVNASEILDSLDSLKKEIRLKFKQMTSQEMLVFSTIYQLESEFPQGVEYRQIASKLKLSESSIRDYTQKLISKGIPVDKIKLNNKKILLKISSELKRVASLGTILKLREL